jgi:hypothetical protein
VLEQEVRELKGQKLSSSTLPVAFSPGTRHEPYDAGSPNPSVAATSESARIPDFQLSPILCRQCVETWFHDYEQWFPIIHKPTFLAEIGDPSAYNDSPTTVVIKAMVAVILPHIELQLDMTLQQKYDISARLRSEVVNAAMRDLDLRSLHALMILVIRDYGDGRIAEAWNLMGVCCALILTESSS